MHSRDKAFVIVFALVVVTACAKPQHAQPTKAPDAVAAPAPVAARAGAPIAISVTEAGFQPDKIEVMHGVATTLVFTRKTDETCAKEVVVDTGAEKITKSLPLNQPVEIVAIFPKSGELGYACGMNMVTGVVTVH